MGRLFTFCKTCETPLDCDFCDKLVELIEPGCMTLEELKAEAKRQGYKLVKRHPRPTFERCLCGHNVHQWHYHKGQTWVTCKMCGLQGPKVEGSETDAIEAWNARIREKKKEAEQ